jgi:hypothetical protein
MMIKFSKFFKVVACLTCLVITINVSAQWPPTGINGNGTQNTPWEITTITQLEALSVFVNTGNGSQTAGKYYKLMNNIFYPATSTKAGWSPIGNNSAPDARFQGNFDGNGNVVSNLMINRGNTSAIGFFGWVVNAEIKNLGIETTQLYRGAQEVGGLVGFADNSIINNCYVTGNVTGNSGVGGLVGMTYYSTLSNSYSLCEVSGVADIGGLAGINKESSITYCYATGDISGTMYYVGGLVGTNSVATLQNCVAANNAVIGGISNVNRIAGTNNGGIVFNNYAFNGMAISPAPSGGEPGISQNMTTLKSFNFYNTGNNWFSNNPWSIDNVDDPLKSWKICDGETLPFLQWEGIDCSPFPPDTCSFNAYGGDGTQGNPYQIYFPCQLADLATFVNSGNGLQTSNKYFKLMNDIDLIAYSTGDGWEPIGYGYYHYYSTQFNGNFDGNGKKITNLKINRDRYDGIALFGSISYATIHDLEIEDCDIIGTRMVGSLVGPTYQSTIKNCYATGTITSTGYLQTNSYAGGLVGEIYYSILENSYSTCDVTGTTGTRSGGLVSQQSQQGTINNCYAAGSVTGYISTGGLVGVNFSTIRNCIAANPTVYAVSGNAINSIVGFNSGGVLSNNYAYDNMIITPNGGVSGISMPMATLMSFNFYGTGSNWYSSIPWSIDAVVNPLVIWGICDTKTLPFFQWQGFNCSKKIIQSGNDEEKTLTVNNIKSSFSIFPNPTSNSITISSEEGFNSLEVVDLFGRIVHSQMSHRNSITLDVSYFSNGIYFIRITSKDGASVLKFVKQ